MTTSLLRRIQLIAFAAVPVFSGGAAAAAQTAATDRIYENPDTRALVSLVDDAAALLHDRGEAAFADFRVAGSRWRQGEAYIFVLDRDGNMRVHPDPSLEGSNHLELKDVSGKPIIRGLIGAAGGDGKPAGWYHYQWPTPDGLLPRWKSTYVRLTDTPTGQRYIVGSGVYNDRMERAFVVDAVTAAAARVEKDGAAAFPMFHDPKGPFIAKDAYVFVIDPDGVELVNPGFPNLEGRNLLDLKDTQGKTLVREMLRVVQTSGSGWVDYMWPKPGDSVSTQKSTYVTRARMGSGWVVVGCGVYLADAVRTATGTRMTAPELMAIVREGAGVLARRGESAYPEFRQKGSRWFNDNTYFFTWTTDGVRAFHAADPALEGKDAAASTDVLGRPYGKMFIDVANTPSGEGWVHYMYPEPDDIFPTWKSTFLKRVTFPSGKQYIVGSGIYNMQMDRAFIQDVVDRAAALVATFGTDAFDELRDKRGSFVFMDTYVFVDTPEGVELVNPGQPGMEGKNLLGVTDVKGKKVADEYIAAAMRDGSAWIEYYWYKPGSNTPARKLSYVKKVQCGEETFIVGSGFYVVEDGSMK